MTRLATPVFVALAGAALLGAVPAGAAKSVAIDVSRIAITESLSPGGEYVLPTFGIRNPGTEPTTYRLTVTYVDGQSAQSPPESWFQFTPRAITLGPGQSRSIATRLELPPGADPGAYAALVGAQIVSEQGGTQVGATAAARLAFEVEPSSLLAAWWNRLKRLLAENAPWSWLVPALLVSLLVARQLRRRFAFTVARR